MSDPARSLSPHESDVRAAPGPLRDWLAAIRAHVPAAPAEAQADVRQEPAYEVRPAARAPEAPWGPRLVQAVEAPRTEAADDDVAELMAENLMLKAKLRLEDERQDELQTLLAAQIRELREHIETEMGSLDDLRTDQEEIRIEREEFRGERERFRLEREEIRAERDRACAERDALRAERQATAAERDTLREERDLWRARTEALVSPLFQPQRR